MGTHGHGHSPGLLEEVSEGCATGTPRRRYGRRSRADAWVSTVMTAPRLLSSILPGCQKSKCIVWGLCPCEGILGFTTNETSGGAQGSAGRSPAGFRGAV